MAMKVATCVIVCFFILHCQCAFWGLDQNYNIISINAETGAASVLAPLPRGVSFNGGEQCVADPVNKILYFVGYSNRSTAVIGVDLTTGDIVSTTPLSHYDCCFIYITFIAKGQVLIVGPSPDEQQYIVSMAYTNTNEVVPLTSWSHPAMMFSGVGPGVFDTTNNVAWVQLPYWDDEYYTVFNMNMGFNILTNQTLHLNDTLDNWALAYSSNGGYVVGMAAFNITWQYPPGEQVGNFGLSKFTSTNLVEELYVFPLGGEWNVLASNIAVDQSMGVAGTIYAAMSNSYNGYYWTSIDIATGNTLNATLLNNGSTFLPPYSCLVYTN